MPQPSRSQLWGGGAGCRLRPTAPPLPGLSLQELTSRDRAQAGNLAASLAAACPLWAAELQTMLASGSKAEIEALDSVEGAGGLVGLLLRCLEEGDVV